jgi:hypothetical protein
MAEHDRDRIDEVRGRNIVRDGGIARSDADIQDVTRDTYSTPIGAGTDDDRETTDEDRTRAREVLGIARDVTPDPEFAVATTSDRRRDADDDLMDGRADVDTSGSSYEGPDGLKVRG